ncbi:reverse transcriptase domain-containing protein [Tanacetum coccineum]
MRSLGAVGSTIHSMIKFPTNQGVDKGTSNLKARSNFGRRPGLGPVSFEKTRSKEDIEEVFTIGHELPDQYVTMGSTLTTNCKQLLADILRENMEVFAWTRSESTTVLWFVMEHQLKIYPLTEPVVHKRRPVAPKGRLALKERVFHWLGEGLIRKVRDPEWITNTIPIKLANGTWKVQMDYSSLNKACSKDMYPFLEEGEELASSMEYPYKCFLQLLKEYNQIRIAEDDEEKIGFHTEEGVYCFTHILKELKNFAATLQRMMEKVLADQRGQNVEIHLEDIVIKSKSEQNLIQDVKETLRKLRRVNIKIDLTMSSFRVKVGKFLGHMVTEEGLRADPERIQAIILSPTLISLNKIRSLFLQLTAISKFILKIAKLKHPLREARTRMETEKEARWTNEAEEALRRIKRKCGKLQTLAIPKEGETLIKEAEGLVMKKFFGQGEQVEGTPDANEGGTFTLSKKLQAKSTPTPRAWRLYVGKETIEEGSGVGIILVSPEEKIHSYAIRLKFHASNHVMDYKALLAGLAASTNQGMKDLHVFINALTLVAQVEGSHTQVTEHERKYNEEILDATTLFHRFQITYLPKNLNSKAEVLTGLATIKLEFLDQEVSVGIKTRPLVEEISSSKKGKAVSNTPRAEPNYNREASGSN